MIGIVILWFFIIVLTILLVKQLKIKKNILICIFISILIVLFVTNINQCILAALDGCKLWYSAILPTTFPFLIICNLLISYDGINIYSKILGPLLCKPLGLSKNCSFPIVASILCGYPLGAKYCADIYSMGYIKKNEYQRLLNIASNVGPLFLIGSVGAALLGNVYFGYILLVGNYLSAIFIGFITKTKRIVDESNSLCSFQNKKINFGSAIKNAVENGISTILSIGGFIVMFSVIISLIKNNQYITIVFAELENILHLNSGTLYGLFLGSIEITNGCNILSTLPLSLPIKLSIISFLCSFSGMAIIAQVSSFIGDTSVNYSRYIFLKIIQGVFSFTITYILMIFLPSSIATSTLKLNFTLNPSLQLMPITILLVLTLIFKIINKLFFHAT